MDRKKRILITGIGVVSAPGTGKAATLEALASGDRNPSVPTLFESQLKNPAFEVKDLPDG
jgi:hypothetical protein